jgi:hypothetical protein
MSFIHDLGQKLGRTAQNVGKKTGEWVSNVGERTEEAATVGKLNVEIGRIKAEIKQLITKLGEAAYSAYAEGLDWNDICGPICEDIQEKHERIAEIESEVTRIREQSNQRDRVKREKTAAKKQEQSVQDSPPPGPESTDTSTQEPEAGFIPQQSDDDALE